MKNLFLSLFVTVIIVFAVFVCGVISVPEHYKRANAILSSEYESELNKAVNENRSFIYDEVMVSAYDEGYSYGKDAGYSAGSIAALSDYPDYSLGYNAGYEAGTLSGYDDGFSDGYDSAYEELDVTDGIDGDSYDHGYEEGYSDCLDEHRLSFGIMTIITTAIPFFALVSVISFMLISLPWFKK